MIIMMAAKLDSRSPVLWQKYHGHGLQFEENQCELQNLTSDLSCCKGRITPAMYQVQASSTLHHVHTSELAVNERSY